MFTKKFNSRECGHLCVIIQDEEIKPLPSSGTYTATDDTVILMFGNGSAFFYYEDEQCIIASNKQDCAVVIKKGEAVRFTKNTDVMLYPVQVSEQHRKIMWEEKNLATSA